MPFYTLPSGDIIEHENRSLIAKFAAPRLVLSTTPLNAGLTRHLKQVFNNDAKAPEDGFCYMLAPDLAGHMAALAAQIGLDPAYSAGLTTAANMENAVIKELSGNNFSVTALITAGVDKNGGRAGDPADLHEPQDETLPPPGTINIMLFINARLTEAAMLQALNICTEAKCAALQELLAPSVYSEGIATGSGTDGTIIVANAEGGALLTNAGQHYRLGELIGRAVIPALKEALCRQTELSPKWQHNALRRMQRFGITAADFAAYPPEAVRTLAEEDQMLTVTSLYAHLLDQLAWGMLSAAEAGECVRTLLQGLGYTPPQAPQNRAQMLDFWRRMFAARLKKI